MNTHSENLEFTALYYQCEQDLFRYILSLVPRHVDALDILQETAVDLWQNFDRYETDRPFGRWARKFAHLRVLRHYQNASRKSRDVLLLGEAVMELLAEEQEVHGDVLAARHTALARCLEKLTDEDWQLLRCRYWSNEKLRDLAVQLGEPEQRLYHRLARIRAKLQLCINETLLSSEEEI